MRILVLCLTLIQVQSIECNIACKKTGYDYGTYSKNSCWCMDRYKYSEITGKKLKISQLHNLDVKIDKPNIYEEE